MISEIEYAGERFPATAVQSLEPFRASRRIRGYLVGAAFMALGIVMILVGGLFGSPNIAIAGLFSFVAGAVWFALPGRPIYGWRVNFHHRSAMEFQFDSPDEAERCGASLMKSAPGIPIIQPSRPQIFWWISG